MYALLFADTGLSGAQISVLFAIWSAVGIVAEVPSGALADRFSRRSVLVVGGILEAAGFALWITLPGFTAFAAGFVLWGLGGALTSGALEALLYDGLAAADARSRFTGVLGQVRGAELLAQVPGAIAAWALFDLGGYPPVGWAGVACCLAAAVVATRLPEVRARPGAAPPAPGDESEGADPGDTGEDEAGYLTTLRAGLAEVATHAAVRRAVPGVALLLGLDAIEEYFTLVAADRGVPTGLVPLAVLAIPVAGALGARWGERWEAARAGTLAVLMGAAAVVLAGSDLFGPVGGVAGIAVFYALYRLVLVVGEARLQHRIESGSRATVTSVVNLGSELAAMFVYVAWALGEVPAIAVLVLVAALGTAWSLQGR